MNQSYLKPNVIVEPLINQWYAWSFLISPATAARYLTQSHLKIMESFVNAPQVHRSALQNPAMRGGPFMNYDPHRVDEIWALLEKTKTEQQALISLSEAISELETLLANHPQGASLEPLYPQIPIALRGFVELVYDNCDRANIRFIEGLLYRSEYYRPESQCVALKLGDTDDRAFVLSTPRLADENSLHLQIPFANHHLDRLFAMRHKPDSVPAMASALGLDELQTQQFKQFFTETPPPQPIPYTGEEVRVRYFGHACVLIETDQVSILCDPLVSYPNLPESDQLPRYSYTDLPETIDYALITHNHQDHLMLETLLQLRHKIKQVIVPTSNKGSLIDPSLKLVLQQIGFSVVHSLDELETIPLPEGQIVSLPVLGEHGDLNIGAKTAYLIQLKGRSILCAADSNNLEPRLYQHLHHLFGDLDLLFLGMECDGAPFTWAYGPLLTKGISSKLAQTRRLDGSNAQSAIALVEELNPKQVYVYAMGQEPWLTFITSIQYTPESVPIQESDRLVAYCRQRGICSDRLLGWKEIFLAPESNRKVFNGSVIKIGKRERETGNSEEEGDKGDKETRGQITNNQQPITNNELQTLLTRLKALNVRLWLDGDNLRCHAPKGVLTAELKAELKTYKPTIINLLRGQGEPNQSQPRSSLDTYVARNREYKNDVVLEESIYPLEPWKPNQTWTAPQKILLTGATGFLGAFLLEQLLAQTKAEIYCLIRADSIKEGEEKLQMCLHNYQMPQDDLHNRVIPLIGDLSQSNLGLSQQQFNHLSKEIEAIHHNGAWVHHASPYSLLRSANVQGTKTILKLACQGKRKPLHYTSTLSVLPTQPPEGQLKMYEQDAIAAYPVPLGGYTQSKWVAEVLVEQGRDRGLPVTVYRPGPISGHSQTGAFNRNDFLYRLIQGYVELGCAPIGEMVLDLLPVDYVSFAMVYLSQKPSSLGKTFHLIHPQPVSSNLLFEPLEKAGYGIDRIPYAQWYEKLIAIAQNNPNHALYPLVSLFSSRRNDSSPPEQNANAQVPFDCQNTQNALKDSPVQYPTLNYELFETYVSAMQNAGVLQSFNKRGTNNQ